jgi:hypothetical protein
VITALLLVWVILAFPLIRERHILCFEGDSPEDPAVIRAIQVYPPMNRTDEYGNNCFYRDSRITVFTWLRNHSEHYTDHTNEKWTSITLAMNQDFLWFLLVVPVAYCVSLPVKRTVDAWRQGSREGRLTIVLITATLIPAIVVNVHQQVLWVPFSVYVFPLFLPLVCVLSHTYGDLAILAVLALFFVITAWGLKRRGINHSRWYAVWTVYVVAVYILTVIEVSF